MFLTIYLWIMMVGSVLVTLGAAYQIGKPLKKPKSPNGTFSAFMINLISTTLFVFWGLQVLGKV